MILDGIINYIQILILRYFLYDTSYRFIYYILTTIIIIVYIMSNIHILIDLINIDDTTSYYISPFTSHGDIEDDDNYRTKRGLQYSNAS